MQVGKNASYVRLCHSFFCISKAYLVKILLPYCTVDPFTLFIVYLLDRTITILDPLPLSDAWKKNPSQKDIFKIQCISFHLNIALQDAIPGWNDDVFRWRRIIPLGVPKKPKQVITLTFQLFDHIFIYHIANNIYSYAAICLGF